ncbi:MAG: hypothetical protein IT293_02460 [Deltaproteobacteria bacterium]|nr:hypothetical protein [Deltaproteobacteria bacterium]
MRRPLGRLIAGLALLCLCPRSAAAAFYLVSISEIGSGFLGDPNVQFVELRLDAAGQTDLANTRLTMFDKDGVAGVLLLTPNGVANGTSGRNVLYATVEFATATGVTPDFVIPAGVLRPSGMVCWGAPDASPPDPSSWDFDKPESYGDCVAYGGYAHATRPQSGTATSLLPGNGAQSLARTQNTGASGDNAADFALAAATACNNAGACASLVPQPTPSATATPSPAPGKAERACRRAVIKAATRFSSAYVNARVACDTERLKNKIPGPCPDAAALARVATAAVKRTVAITKACGALPPSAAGFGAACPGHTGACTNAIASVTDVSACLDCGLRRAADELLTLAYATAPDPGLLGCQRGFGKAIAAHYRGAAALLARCEDGAARGKIAGSCPDAKTAARIAAKEAKLRTTLCRACGGDDRQCHGAPDVAPAALAITSCPARTMPGGAACGAIPITDLAGVASCAACVAAFDGACASQLAARPDALPAACSAP